MRAFTYLPAVIAMFIVAAVCRTLATPDPEYEPLALRKPLVMVGGQVSQLPVGDTLFFDNGSVSGTLGVTGVSTLGVTNTGAFSGTTGTFSSTLGVSGTTTTVAINASGQVNVGGGAAVLTTAGTITSTGNVRLGNSTTNTHTIWGHLTYLGSSPALTTCGTSEAIAGTDRIGRVTIGAATTTCTINFSRTWTVAPSCTVHAEVPTQPTYTVSADAITISVGIASTSYHYSCGCVGASCT